MGSAAVGPALGSAAVGPALGGLLAATAGWRAVFAVNIPLALLALFGALAWLPADRKDRESGPAKGAPAGGLDPLGMVLFAAVLTCAMFFLLDLAHPQWPLPAAAAGLTGVLVRWQLRRPEPFLDLRMLARNGPLVRTYLRHGLAYLVIYCVLYGFSQWLEEGHGFSSFQAGLIMLPMSAAAACCSLAGARTKGIRAPLTVAAGCLAVGSAVFLLLQGSSPLFALLCAGVLFGIPQGLTSTGNQAAVYAQAPDGGVGAAAGLQRTAQYLGAITAAGLIGLLYGAHGTDLDRELRERGVTQIVLGGIATSIGVESTARAAYEHGYHVTLATDAMTDLDADAHRNSVQRVFPRLGETGTADAIRTLLG
ncbi:MFS transporter [Streptomyces platensis]|uniref:MFS transporter n=1 Tax=Streptomyces platensis TaxID=58346 RepID=UPI003F605878